MENNSQRHKYKKILTQKCRDFCKIVNNLFDVLKMVLKRFYFYVILILRGVFYEKKLL